MKGSSSRKKALRALYRCDRAEALRELYDALGELHKVESLIASTRSRAVSLRAQLESPSPDGNVLAGRLQMDLADREYKRSELKDLVERQQYLAHQEQSAKKRLDASRHEVIKAHKALNALTGKN